MASEIRVNKINSRTGVGTITLSPTGVDFTGIATVSTLKATTGIVTTLSVTGTTTLNGNLDLQDNDKILAGTGDDLEFYHDGTHSHIVSNTGNLRILADGSGSLVLTSKAGEEAITCAQDGAVTIKHDNSTKFATTSTGVTITGTATADGLSLGDSEYAYFGASNDLSIVHNGSDSLIADTGTGDLYIRGSNNIYLQKGDGSETFIATNDDGAVEIYHDNVKKIDTVSGGQRIFGYLSMQGSGGHVYLPDSAELKIGNGEDLQIYHNGTDSFIEDSSRHLLVRAGGSGDLYLQSNSKVLITDVGGNETFIECNDNGNVELYHNNSKKFETKSDGVVVTGGIYLDGSGGTGSANKLDDYEEGTWTPVFGSTSGSFTSVTYSVQSGTYTKIGNRVFIDVRLQKTAHTIGTAGGYLLINGLPFQVANSEGAGGGSPAISNFNFPDNVVNVSVEMRENTTQFYPALYTRDNATFSNLGPSTMNSGTAEIRATFSYYTNS